MENTILIGGEQHAIRANAITALHYKNQFNSDILADTFRALGGVQELLATTEMTDKEQLATIVEGIDSILVYQLVWAHIKTADIKFMSFNDWLEQIEYSPVTDLLLQDNFLELLTGNLTRKKK